MAQLVFIDASQKYKNVTIFKPMAGRMLSNPSTRSSMANTVFWSIQPGRGNIQATVKDGTSKCIG